MSVGPSTTHANAILNVLRNTAYTGITPYLKVHTGDPGAAGTTNASANTTRQALTFAAPSAGSTTASQVSWSAWAAGSETITHWSIWDASTAGTFIQSGALSTSKAMTNGDTLQLTVTLTAGTVAA
jgi:hypothetical protein